MSSSDNEPNGSVSRGAAAEHRDSADSSASINQHLLMVSSLYDEIEQQRKSSISFDKIKQISLTYSLQSEDEPTSLEFQTRNSALANHAGSTQPATAPGGVEPDRKSRVITEECEKKSASFIEQQDNKSLRYNSLELAHHETNGGTGFELVEEPIGAPCTPTRSQLASSNRGSIRDHSSAPSGWNKDFREERTQLLHRYNKQAEDDRAPPAVIGIKLGQHQVSLSFNESQQKQDASAGAQRRQMSTTRLPSQSPQVCRCCSRSATIHYGASAGCANNNNSNNQCWRMSRDENAESVSVRSALPRHSSPIDKPVKNNGQQQSSTYESRPTSEIGYSAYRAEKSEEHRRRRQTTEPPARVNEAAGRKRPAPEVGARKYSGGEEEEERRVGADERQLSLSPASKLSGLIEELSLNLNGSGANCPTGAGPPLNDIDYSLASGSSCCSSGRRRVYERGPREEPMLFWRSPVEDNMPNCNGARHDSLQPERPPRPSSVRGALNPWEQPGYLPNDDDEEEDDSRSHTGRTGHRLACSSPATTPAAVRCTPTNNCRASRASSSYMDDDDDDDGYDEHEDGHRGHEYDDEDEDEHDVEYPTRIDIVIKSPQRRRRPQLKLVQCTSQPAKMSKHSLRQCQVMDQSTRESSPINNTAAHSKYEPTRGRRRGVSPVAALRSRLQPRGQEEPSVNLSNSATGSAPGTAPKQSADDFQYNQISLLEARQGKQVPAFDVVKGASRATRQVKPAASRWPSAGPSNTQTVAGDEGQGEGEEEEEAEEPACVRVALHQCGAQLEGRSCLPEVGAAATPAVVSGEARATGKAIKIKDDQPVVVRGAPSEQVEPCSSMDTSTKQQQLKLMPKPELSGETQTPDPQLLPPTTLTTAQKKDGPLFAAPKYLSEAQQSLRGSASPVEILNEA